MASSSKKKTTFAKMNREAAVRERRQLKEARRAARKLEAQTRSDTRSEPVATDVVVDESPDA
jgi:hypothetical protein